MTDTARLARIHAACFAPGQAWSSDAFDALLANPGCVAFEKAAGFALMRRAADEAELLTIAVLPNARRQGTARALMQAFEDAAAARGATRALLEVAADNDAALALYRSRGWVQTARRPAYYARPGATRCDALIMAKSLG